MLRVLALVITVAVMSTGASASSGDVWSKLQRPLHIPRIAHGTPCPVTKNPRSGPAYPLLGPTAAVGFRFPAPPGSVAYGSPWSAVRVAWAVRPGYRGPLLIRGRQLDGSNALRFEHGQIPGTARFVPARTGRGARTFHSLLRVRTPGCYAFQVDGLTFSRTIVFRVQLISVGDESQVVSTMRARGLAMSGGAEFPSIAFDDFFHIRGHEYVNPQGSVVFWQFPSFEEARSVLIDRGGLGVTLVMPGGGQEGASIFCGKPPCSSEDDPPVRHWYRNGSIIAVYLGDDTAILSAIERLFGEQIAGTDAPSRCLAAPVRSGEVHAGPFTGEVSSEYVVDGRFRLHVLAAGAGLTNKMGWLLPRKRAKQAPWLSVKGVRLAGSRRVFTDQLAEAFGAGFPEDQHAYASNLGPPTAGCWRLTFKTRRVTGSLVVLVRNG